MKQNREEESVSSVFITLLQSIFIANNALISHKCLHWPQELPQLSGSGALAGGARVALAITGKAAALLRGLPSVAGSIQAPVRRIGRRGCSPVRWWGCCACRQRLPPGPGGARGKGLALGPQQPSPLLLQPPEPGGLPCC